MNNANYQAQSMQKVATGDIMVPIKEACEFNGEYSEAYPIGFPIFDNSMKVIGQDRGGVRNGDLVVITGISGHGKTTLAQNIALNLNNIPIPTAFFSYEVLIDNLYAKFKQMGFDEENFPFIFAPKKIITGNIRWISEKIEETMQKHFTKVIFIDHIDFLMPANHSSQDQLRMRLRNICQELKTIAINKKVIIFLMVHTKKVEGREVEMQDIAESSGIYQLADYIFSVARGSQIETVQGKDIKTFTDTGIIKILKNRLTGKMPYMQFSMVNNKIKPYDNL